MLEATRKVRSTKIFAGLGMLDSSMTVKLNNFGHMECNNIREFVRMTFDTFYCIEKVGETGSAALPMPEIWADICLITRLMCRQRTP